jgi:DNA repair exonuclease SbcCD ATPase subunit
MGSLADLVSELEDDHESTRQECRHLEEQLEDVEQDLETKIQQLNQLQAFKDWVALAYPVVVKDYECVKVIEEVANGL